MLLDFSASNFRCIDNEVTLSAASVYERDVTRKRPETGETHLIEGRGQQLVPVLGIFGPNASGKTTVLGALSFLLRQMLHIESDSFESLRDVEPFAFPRSAIGEVETTFRIRIALHEGIFIYRLDIQDGNVKKEELQLVPNASKRFVARTLYARQWNEIGGTPHWTMGRELRAVVSLLVKTLPNNRPLLPMLLTLGVPLLSNLLRWLSSSLYLDDAEREVHLKATVIAMRDYPNFTPYIKVFLQGFDLDFEDLLLGPGTENMSPEYRIRTSRHFSDANVDLPLAAESLGTRWLVSAAGMLSSALTNGSLAVIDELQAHLHPHIVYRIIEMFQHKKTNPLGAQLIFSSHDASLLDQSKLGRDEIWFTERRPDRSTDLYPLSAFQVRADRSIEKAYLAGLFGAVPIIPSFSLEAQAQ